MQTIKKERNSSLELLRIISMLLIVAAHFSVHGNFPKPTVETLDFSYVCLQLLGLYAYVGVAAFMLLTGYFMVTSTRRNGRKALKLVVDIIFYSLFMLAVCSTFHLLPLNKTDIIGSISPWGYYWFVVNYIVILLLAPYINTLLLRLSKRQYFWLLLVYAMASRLLPYFMLGHISITGGTIDYFILFYLIGGYIKLHVKQSCDNKWNLVVAVLAFLTVAMLALTVDGVALWLGNNAILQHYIHFKNLDGLPVDICAIALFLYFSRLEFKSKVVNRIASYTLDVYLVHTNRLMMKVFWGGGCLSNIMYLHSPWFLPFAIAKILGVYTVSTIVGWVKSKTWDVIFNHWLDVHYIRIEEMVIRKVKKIVK